MRHRYAWYNWPAHNDAGDRRGLVPWYIVAWRVLWMIPFWPVYALLIALIFIQRGPRMAREFIDAT